MSQAKKTFIESIISTAKVEGYFFKYKSSTRLICCYFLNSPCFSAALGRTSLYLSWLILEIIKMEKSASNWGLRHFEHYVIWCSQWKMVHMQIAGLAERQSFGETSFFLKRTNSSASHFCHVEICFFHFSSRSALKSLFDDFSTSTLTHWHGEKKKTISVPKWVGVCVRRQGRCYNSPNCIVPRWSRLIPIPCACTHGRGAARYISAI